MKCLMYHMSIVLSRWTVFSCMVILKYSDNGSVAKFLQTWPLVSWTWIIITSGFMCRPFHWKILSASAVHATVVVESNIYPGLIAPWSVNNLNYTTTITMLGKCSMLEWLNREKLNFGARFSVLWSVFDFKIKAAVFRTSIFDEYFFFRCGIVYSVVLNVFIIEF